MYQHLSDIQLLKMTPKPKNKPLISMTYKKITDQNQHHLQNKKRCPTAS